MTAGSAACACKSQLASLLDCQMPLRLGLPSTRAGRDVCDWPEEPVMDAETTAPSAAAAIATVIVEPKRRSSIEGPPPSFGLPLRLPQRIVFYPHEIRGPVPCCGVRAARLRKRKLFHARSPQQPRQTVISLDAARLSIHSILLVAQLNVILLGSPRAYPHGRIVNCHSVFERG